MTEGSLDKTAAHKTSFQDRLASDWSHYFDARNTTTLAAACFLMTVAVMFMYRPFSQVEDGDSALLDYIAQCVVRGQIPYKDVIEIKAPGSFYLSALAMEVGRGLGVRDIIAARLLHIVLAGFLLAVVYLVCDAYLRNRFAGLLAVLVLLSSEHFAFWTVGGGQPKLPMILFGMLTLLLTAKDRPFLAGFCSMLSCLCWQPGLLFTGVAFLIFSRYLTTWRDLRALKVLAGAAIPLGVLLLYFRSVGALDDLWIWTVVFNYSIYARKTLEGAGSSLSHLLKVTLKVFKVDIVLVVLSLTGFVLFGIRLLRERLGGIRNLKSPNLFQDAIVLAPLAYFAACLVRFNAGPYLIPFVPFVGIFFGWFVTESVRMVKKGRYHGIPAEGKNAYWLPNVVLLFMLSLTGYRAIAYQFESIPTLQDQDRKFEALSSMLSGSETIYVHGTTEILVLLNKPNLNPYIFLDSGKDDYVAAKKYGGSFEAIVDEIDSGAPKIVALSRLERVSHRHELRRWVEQHYEPLSLPGYDVYARKQ
jgi:DolP-mannose mannosyltransferase